MSSIPSLKKQNAWLIRATLGLHIIIFGYVTIDPLGMMQLTKGVVIQELQNLIPVTALSVAIIGLTKLLLLGLIPSRLRDRLIHWRWRNPLPGSRAFSKIGPKDPRVDIERLRSKYGELPLESNRQDKLFYSIYKAHETDVGVLDAHASYLAARDIGIINLLLTVLLPPCAYWAAGNFERTIGYAAILFASYLVVARAAQVYGARLVENTLAAASSQ